MSKLIGSLFLTAAFACMIASASAQDAKSEGKLGGKKLDVEQVFKKLDADGNGKLSRDEFLKMAEKAPDAEKQTKVREFLGKVFDKISKDDSVTLDQLKKFQSIRDLKLKKKSDAK